MSLLHSIRMLDIQAIADAHSLGNNVSYFSIEQAHRGLTVTATSQVDVANRQLPSETRPWEEMSSQLKTDRSAETIAAYQFAFASESMKPFAGLGEYAKTSFTPGRPFLDAAVELTSRIYDDFDYDPKATTIHAPIQGVLGNRHGVCQDFAHLQIGCLRSLGLAARYVSGYLRTEPPPGKPRLVGADASHAWHSVYCGEAGWIDVDPTNGLVASSDHITVAWGADYNDVCSISGRNRRRWRPCNDRVR
jgi:transglutaminase-like putative cysteine protease